MKLINKLKPAMPVSALEKMYVAWSLLAVLVHAWVLYFYWPQLPELFPAQFNASGEATYWMSKQELLHQSIRQYFWFPIFQLFFLMLPPECIRKKSYSQTSSSLKNHAQYRHRVARSWCCSSILIIAWFSVLHHWQYILSILGTRNLVSDPVWNILMPLSLCNSFIHWNLDNRAI